MNASAESSKEYARMQAEGEGRCSKGIRARQCCASWRGAAGCSKICLPRGENRNARLRRRAAPLRLLHNRYQRD